MNENIPYHLLGGEQGIKDLVKAFYQIMDADKSLSTIRKMHKASLDMIEERLFEYLSGWLGGPALYQEKYGTICLTSPHKGYHLDEEARDQWLRCMDLALDSVEASNDLKTMVKPAFFEIADFMRNVK